MAETGSHTSVIERGRNLLSVAGVVGVGALALLAANARAGNQPDSPGLNRAPNIAISPHPIRVGVMDDRLRTNNLTAAKFYAASIKSAGFSDVKITMPVTPGSIDVVNDLDGLCNAAEAAQDNGLGLNVLFLNRFEKGMGWIPVNASERLRFKTTIASAISRLNLCEPHLSNLGISIGNEPNSETFVKDQISAPSAYVRMLSDVYPIIQAKVAEINSNRPDQPLKITVYGGELSADDDPIDFINSMAQAITDLGIKTKMLDVFTIHPYPQDPTAPLDEPTKKGYFGLSQSLQLKTAVDYTFGSNTPIMFSESGVESVIPATKFTLYSSQQSESVSSVIESVQADSYSKMLSFASCLPDSFKGFVFFLYQDDPQMDRYQSGLAYANGDTKTSYPKIKIAIQKARAGAFSC